MRIKALVNMAMTLEVDGELDDPENMLILDWDQPDFDDVMEAQIIEVLDGNL